MAMQKLKSMLELQEELKRNDIDPTEAKHFTHQHEADTDPNHGSSTHNSKIQNPSPKLSEESAAKSSSKTQTKNEL